MKLQVSTNFIESGNTQAVGKFSIKQSPLAFQILSSSLYSDKIRAVIRELACNAADAHVAAGIPDQPIIVKLPTNDDRTFYVQDNGPGLTHDEICSPEDGLYTTYFASSKTHSNDETGAFGLGSKSPFAYTDQFTLEVARDGEHRTYVCYKDDKGYLSCDLMETRPASDKWPHGLKVSMPVAPKDFDEFDKKARDLFRWFRVTPTVYPTAVGKSIKPTIEKAAFGFERATSINDKQGWRIGRTDPMVIMGNVAYPIEVSKMTKQNTTSMMSSLFNTVSGCDTVIRVPIGAVSITPSRESMEYTDLTIASLSKIIRELFASKFKAFLDEVRATDGTLTALTALQAKYVEDTHWQAYAGIFSNHGAKFAKMLNETYTDEDAARMAIACSTAFPLEALFPSSKYKSNDVVMHELRTRKRSDGSFMVSKDKECAAYCIQNISEWAFYEADCPSAEHILKWNMRQRHVGDRVMLVSDPAVIAHLKTQSRSPTLLKVSTLTKPPKPVRLPGGTATRKRGEGRSVPVWDASVDYEAEGIEITDGYTPPMKPLALIPPAERFYIVRQASYGRRSWYSTGQNKSIGQSYWGSDPDDFFDTLNEVHELDPTLGIPRKVLVLTDSLRDKLYEKKISITPIADRLEEIAEAVLEEGKTLRKGFTSKKQDGNYNHDLYELIAISDHHPCTFEGDEVLDLMRLVYKDRDLYNLLASKLPVTHPIIDTLGKITLKPDAPAAAPMTKEQERYNHLIAIYTKLTNFVRGLPSFDPTPGSNTRTSGYELAVQLFNRLANDKTLRFAARVLKTKEELKVAKEKVNECVLIALS